MAQESEEINWPSNYFNYFTEVEEHFQKARGTGLFLMSPLDWALVEAWKNAGVPLEAVLRGIDSALENWRGKRKRIQMVNSVAYCTQAIMIEAQVMAGTVPAARARKESPAPFSVEEIENHLRSNAAEIQKQDPYVEIARAVERLAVEISAFYGDLEDLERRLTALEDKMIAIARSRQTDEDLLRARRELDLQLRPYRGKMTAEQLSMLERQYLERQLLESSGLPRLSLFYLR
jgi:predicted RNase H-like nuclease (RuvC/YqgF family)